MAYRDIEMWRQILESEEQEQRAYDDACAEREAEGKMLDEQEFWDCDQQEIDPRTMGLDTEVVGSGSPELADVEDVDEDIDFSEYGIGKDELDEADMREPLTAVTAALGRPASTANLCGQDSVALAEAIRELTTYLKKSKTLTEAEEDQPAEDGEAEDDEAAYAADAAKADAAEKDSKDALAAAKRFYQQWLSDPDFRRRAAYKTPEGAIKKVPAGHWKKGEDGRPEITTADDPEGKRIRGDVVAGTDPDSDLAQQFKGYFDRMSDVDKLEFDAWASRQTRFTTKQYGPRRGDNLNKKGDLHGKNGDDDDDVNPLAQHGLDQTFNADNANDGMFDDPDVGEEFYSEFNPDYQTISHEGVARHIIDVANAEAKRLGITREEYFEMFKKLAQLAMIKKTVLNSGRKNKPLTDYQLEYIFGALDADQLAELKDELMKDAGDNRKERAFIEYLFRVGKERQVNLKDLLKEFGIAGDQAGDTGAGTQQGDVMVYVVICALAEAYNIMQDEANELWRVKASQAPTKTDKNLNIEPRKYARHLACKILQDLFDELQQPGMPRVEIPQSAPESYRLKGAAGQKIKAGEWKEVQKKIGGLLALIFLRGDKAEQADVANALKAKFQKYNGGGGEEGEREARKLKTYLDQKQNEEFQRLLEKVRTAFDEMTDEEKIRLVQLDRMRLGDDELAAQTKARKAFDTAMKKKPEAWDYVVKKVAKGFLSGGSANLNRDGIDVRNPNADADNGHNGEGW